MVSFADWKISGTKSILAGYRSLDKSKCSNGKDRRPPASPGLEKRISAEILGLPRESSLSFPPFCRFYGSCLTGWSQFVGGDRRNLPSSFPVSSTGHLLLAEHWLPSRRTSSMWSSRAGAVLGAVIPLFLPTLPTIFLWLAGARDARFTCAKDCLRLFHHRSRRTYPGEESFQVTPRK